jgi:hypothetical protein
MKKTSLTKAFVQGLEQWRTRFTFLVLAIIVILLYGFILYEAWYLHSLGGILVLIVLVNLIAALIFEAKRDILNRDHALDTKMAMLTVAATVVGAWATYEFNHSLALGAVVASAIVGLIGAAVFPRHAAAIYCGSFVGMASSSFLMGFHDLMVAALIAGLLFSISEDVLGGFGGKLGTIAFCGVLIAGLGFKRQFEIHPVPPPELAWRIVLSAIAATMLTTWLSTKRNLGPVRASCLVGLIGGLLAPAVFPQYGNSLAVVIICASFTGMSSSERMPSYWMILAAGLLTGIIFLYSFSLFGGAGGKLGTIAFGACLAVWGARETLLKICVEDSEV